MQTLSEILSAHRDGSRTLAQTVAGSYARLRALDDPAMFIALKPESEALAEAERLQAEGARGRALWGVPVAIKDNIDVVGLPTTFFVDAGGVIRAKIVGEADEATFERHAVKLIQ